jgi:hypothetical protein
MKAIIFVTLTCVLSACAQTPLSLAQEYCNAQASQSPALLITSTAAPGLYSDTNKKNVRASRNACMRAAGF